MSATTPVHAQESGDLAVGGSALQGVRDRARYSDRLRTWIPLLFAIVGLSVYASANSDLYLTGRNLDVLLDSVAVLGLVTVGMTLLLAAGQLDLSVGAAATLASVVGAKLIVGGASDVVAIVVMLALPAAIGIAIGLVVTSTGVQPFILTLGMLSVLQSLSLIQTGQRPISVGQRLADLSTSQFLSIPLSFWMFVAALLVGAAILHLTRLGRSAFAVGSNEEAAYLSGIPVARVKIAMFALSGTLVGAAGMLLLSRLGAGDAASGSGLELDAIAAAVIGGASLLGGRGSMVGTFLGVLLLGVIANSLTLLDVSSFYQRLVLGVLLIFAVVATAIAEKRRGSVESAGEVLRRLVGARRT
ncbi:MAG: ribose transport system substrate-binding protein rbsC [Solirubrobacteraceae bacterium]